MNRPINRADPLMPAQDYKTYQIRAPRSSHFRKATCAEVDCPNYLNGWRTRVDVTSDLGKAQAEYIRKQSGRKFTVISLPNGITEFEFEAGQNCFQTDKHLTRLEKPELYIVRDGDWRGNPRRTEAYIHKNAAEWTEDFAEHQDTIKTQIEKG